MMLGMGEVGICEGDLPKCVLLLLGEMDMNVNFVECVDALWKGAGKPLYIKSGRGPWSSAPTPSLSRQDMPILCIFPTHF